MQTQILAEPGTGNLFIGDVGDGTWEELDLGVEGANYGYPLVEGPQPPGVPGMTYPVYSYNHNGGGASITGGDHMVAGCQQLRNKYCSFIATSSCYKNSHAEWSFLDY